MKPTLISLGCAASLLLATVVGAAERTAPKLLSPVSPGYPVELQDSGLNGAAEVDIVVKADGSVADAKLAMASHRAFGRAAMEAVVEWKFQAGLVDGKAVDQKVSVPFRFAAPPEQVVNAVARRKVFVELPEPALGEKDFPARKLKVRQPARPQYPRALMAAGVEEKIQVKLVVAPDGSTLNPSVVSTKHKEFEEPAMVAAALMKYDPPVKDGKPVYVETVTTIEFANNAGRRGGGGNGGGAGGGFGGFGGGGGGGGNRGDFGGGNPD